MNKTKITPQTVRQLRQTGEVLDLEENDKTFLFEKEESREDEKKKAKEKINQMKAQKEAWARRRREEIESEIRLLVQKRQEEMRRRKEYEEDKEKKENEERIAQEKATLPEVPTKPKKGLFWGRRIKTAQQQAQPETAGRRIGG